MKLFFANNWYKLSIALSLLISSIAFLLFSATKGIADPHTADKSISDDFVVTIVGNSTGIYAVGYEYNDVKFNWNNGSIPVQYHFKVAKIK